MTLLICGAGQYGMVTKEIAEAMGGFSRILFLDDHSEIAVGKLSEIHDVAYDMAVVAIGNPIVRLSLLSQIKNPATLIHPRAMVMPSAEIGAGSVVEPGAVIGSRAKIGVGTIVMANAVVGHDATVGNGCQLKYGCAISERCQVPDQTKVDCLTVYRN